MTKQALISVVVPVHNESENLSFLHKALGVALKEMPYRFELIFVDDGSKDESLLKLEALAQIDKRIRIIEFARNFGKEAAVSAGLHHAKGVAAVIMDADLQHPPSVIPRFIEKWQKGADVVTGIKTYSKKISPFKRFPSWLFYKMITPGGVAVVKPNTTDFRLVTRKVIQSFNGMTERNRMTRALLDWLGFRQVYVRFNAPPRANGEASYGFRQLFKLALNCLTSHSMLPLQFAGYLGLVILLSAGALGVFMYIEKYILGDPYKLNFTGTAMLATLIVFLVGLVLVCLGLVSLYIARIHTEVANRPLYVVRRDTLYDQEVEQ